MNMKSCAACSSAVCGSESFGVTIALIGSARGWFVQVETHFKNKRARRHVDT